MKVLQLNHKVKKLLLLGLTSLAFSSEVCIKHVENPYPEPYLNIALRKILERALLSSGKSLGCSQDAKELKVFVKEFKEEPLAYTPLQRVSTYNLRLSISLVDGVSERTYTQSISYPQPTGALGNMPRREAIDTIMGIIYLDILRDMRRRF